MTDSNRDVTRRGFLSAAGTAATVGGASGVVAAQEDGGGPKEVLVGPGGDFTFEPETVYAQPGQTIRWVWESDFHNIVPQEIPSGASWEGTPGGQSEIYNTGYTYEHSFDTMGTYNYVCWPHRQSGMVGDVVINETGQPPGGGGGGGSLPDSARTLGVAATGALVSVLGLAYFFLKYGGDDGTE